jgi:hypothetical protein
MRGNIAFTELPLEKEVWLVAIVTSVSKLTARNGKPYYAALARNGSGTVSLRCWSEVIDQCGALRPGLYGITGRLASYQELLQFVVTTYRPIPVQTYHEQQQGEPPWPLAFTLDIECVPQPRYRKRVSDRLGRAYADGTMKAEQRQRYEVDRMAEEERAFREGALAGTTAQIIAIAVHVAPRAEFAYPGMRTEEYLFGIDEHNHSLEEKQLLTQFIDLMCARFDPETSEVVTFCGLTYDLPVILQRCVVHGIHVPPIFDIGSFNSRNVFDVHRKWLAGAKAGKSTLDDVLWALGYPSSKSAEVNGRMALPLYEQGRFAEIRRYVRDDARATRECYEAIVAALGRGL